MKISDYKHLSKEEKKCLLMIERDITALTKKMNIRLKETGPSTSPWGLYYKLILPAEDIILCTSTHPLSLEESCEWSYYLSQHIKKHHKTLRSSRGDGIHKCLILHLPQNKEEPLRFILCEIYGNNGEFSLHQCKERRIESALKKIDTYREQIFLKECEEEISRKKVKQMK